MTALTPPFIVGFSLIILAIATSALPLLFEPSIPSLPSSVRLENVSQKYPVTLMGKLFSSVPKREYALQKVNLSFGPTGTKNTNDHETNKNDYDKGVVLLVGRSASGKSTILRLLAGMESPTEGTVSVNGRKILQWQDPQYPSGKTSNFAMPIWMKIGMPMSQSQWEMASKENDDSDENIKIAKGDTIMQPCVQPVILERKPDFDNSMSVMQRINQIGNNAVEQQQSGAKSMTSNSKRNGDISRAQELIGTLARDFAGILELSEEQCNSRPSDLSPSGQYLFGIACACMVSVSPAIVGRALGLHDTSTTKTNSEDDDEWAIPYPILLLDELFDMEASSTVEKCSRGLLNLIRHGGVVVSATHRPGYFNSMASRVVTVSGGKILTEERRRILFSSHQ